MAKQPQATHLNAYLMEYQDAVTELQRQYGRVQKLRKNINDKRASEGLEPMAFEALEIDAKDTPKAPNKAEPKDTPPETSGFGAPNKRGKK